MTAVEILALVDQYGAAVAAGDDTGAREVLAQVDAAVTQLANQRDEARAEPVVEHAVEMSSGAMQVRWDDPAVNDIFPLASWIESKQRFGGHVYRRTVVVVEDWTEVERQEAS